MKKILYLIPLLASAGLYAANWNVFFDLNGGGSVSYDSASIQKNGNLISVWAKVSRDSPVTRNGMTYDSSNIFLTINCKNRQYLSGESFFYLKDSVVGSLPKDGEYRNLIPETFPETLRNILCKK
jgi:hypothetical protein